MEDWGQGRVWGGERFSEHDFEDPVRSLEERMGIEGVGFWEDLGASEGLGQGCQGVSEGDLGALGTVLQGGV